MHAKRRPTRSATWASSALPARYDRSNYREGEQVSLRRRSSTALIAATIATVTLAIPAPVGAQPVARIACTRDVSAVIGGEHKCLGSGEYCATRYERQYERYGFVCSTRYNPPRLRRK
jgi:hypothetical protein